MCCPDPGGRAERRLRAVGVSTCPSAVLVVLVGRPQGSRTVTTATPGATGQPTRRLDSTAGRIAAVTERVPRMQPNVIAVKRTPGTATPRPCDAASAPAAGRSG